MMAGPTSGEAHSTGNAAGPKGDKKLPYQHSAKPLALPRFTQRDAVLAALQQRPHHGLELRKMGVKNPARYVGDLVLMGHDVDSAPTCVLTPTGHILSTTLYTLGVQHG